MRIGTNYISYANKPYQDNSYNTRVFVIMGIVAVVIITVVIAIFSRKK